MILVHNENINQNNCEKTVNNKYIFYICGMLISISFALFAFQQIILNYYSNTLNILTRRCEIFSVNLDLL